MIVSHLFLFSEYVILNIKEGVDYMCNCNNKDSKCIAEILKVICILQQNANCSECCLETCDRGFLGNSTNCVSCNTRPIMLYTCSGNGTNPWTMPTTRENVTCGDVGVTCSSVFRIEKIDENCATFRVLAANPDAEAAALSPYIATNSFFTMNLGCVCALKCLNDTFVECI